MNPLLSICIPSYNRPNTLIRLLNSIKTKYIYEIEIIIAEDKSPKREEIKNSVFDFVALNSLNVKLIENEINLGYDKNLRNLIHLANGNFVLFMGDDDVFVDGALDKFIEYIKNHMDIAYFLRSYQKKRINGSLEIFRYFDKSCEFSPGFDSYTKLFRKSVFISGFTINRDLAEALSTDVFDNTLLYQLYLVSEIALNFRCAYPNIILTELDENGIPFFGSSETEKELYTPGEITINNSINFIKGYFKITNYIDIKYNIDSTKIVRLDMSKYSYPILSIQRDKGLKLFKFYYKELNKIGLNVTPYYYIYYIALCIFGVKVCDSIILFVKRMLKRTPKL